MEILDIFKKITTIPHCSKDTKKLQDFILKKANKYGYKVEIDRARNILCYKNKREICLQSHIDMVCVGEAPNIKIIEKDGWLMAKNSSLGADNGIGVALMIYLMSRDVEAEYLFTNDEEIGLIGANNLELNLKSRYMLNLDSEELGNIYIGCAGGADIKALKNIKYKDSKKDRFYKIISKNFPGGHSGVDIDKNIPNAIKEFAFFVENADISYIQAGERRNSIPVNLEAIVATNKILKSSDYFLVKEIEKVKVIDFDILKLILSFADGIRGWFKDYDTPLKSANLARVYIDNDILNIEASLRANINIELKKIVIEYKTFFNIFDMDIKIEDEYPAWEAKISSFAKKVQNIYKKYNIKSEFKVIHAGLESAVLSKKFSNMQIVSIGPNIKNPHSTREMVEIESIKIFQNIVMDIVKSV